ncbi:MAG: hypothetical protein EPO06_01545 [Burkholderiaceae bacterium]|nr:MAG: hypothetical protein EPO06_01545 [Burkholderiaceae bacterium]
MRIISTHRNTVVRQTPLKPAAGFLFCLLLAGCATERVPDNRAQPSVAPPAPAVAAQTPTAATPVPAETPTEIPAAISAPSPTPTMPAAPAKPTSPGTRQIAKAAAPTVASSATPAVTPSAAPKPAGPPPMDLKALEQQLRETKAIGLMTKLTLKNQIDDLLGQFRDYYDGRLKATLADLRPPFDRLVMKVLTLLQDADAALARSVAASREALWALLADPVKFKTLT